MRASPRRGRRPHYKDILSLDFDLSNLCSSKSLAMWKLDQYISCMVICATPYFFTATVGELANGAIICYEAVMDTRKGVENPFLCFRKEFND